MPETLADFHFLRPWWLVLLLAIPLLAFLQLRFLTRGNSWQKILDASLYDALMEEQSYKTRGWTLVVSATVLAIAAVALAGPTFERLPQPVETRNDPLVIVLDLTLSMTSTDVRPTRIERAKFKVADVLESREEGLVGLVAYAGDAYVVTPLTHDDATILNLMNSLDPSMMPLKGSNTVVAIERANELLNASDVINGHILLITDGIPDFAASRMAVDASHPISILGVGTAQGPSGPRRSPAFEADQLRDFAMVTGGRYSTVTLDDSDIENLLARRLNFETQRLEDQAFDVWHDVGYLLLIPLVVLLAFSMRRGALFAVLLLVGVHAEGGWMEDLWIPKDRQAWSKLEQGNSVEAETLFEDRQWRGIAHFRSGKFDKAQKEFTEGSSLDSLYNRGNALAWSGRLDEAILAYDEVLSNNPDHEDAKHNKLVLEQLMEQLSNQTSQGESGEEQSQNQENEQSEGGQAQSSQDDSDSSRRPAGSELSDSNQNSQGGDDQPSENQQNLAQDFDDQQPSEGQVANEQRLAQSDSQDSRPGEVLAEGQPESVEEREQRETYERWLRRIPDDPGDLLARKFEAESSNRIERGELERNEVGPAW